MYAMRSIVLLATSSAVSAYPWLADRAADPAITALPIPSNLPLAIPPNPNDPRFSQYKAPGPGDVRSPCPGLNACANHGFIPHSGKGNTLFNLIPGLSQCWNMGADFTIAIASAGFLSAPNPLAGSFDLNMLDEHNFPIEHDASLSRQDAYFGNNYAFYEPNFDMVLAQYAGSKYTNISAAAKARHARFADSNARNPTFTFGLREFIFAYGESALYLQALSDPFSGVARVDFLKEWFQNDKLPYDIGWRPSTQPITLVTLANMVFELFNENPEEIPEGFVITVDTIKDVFEGIDPLTGILANATSNL